MNKKNIPVILLFVGVYIFATGISYLFFSGTASSKTINTQPKSTVSSSTGAITFDDSLPKTEECPLNGVKYSKQQKDWWEQQRPLGVMIENHPEARPQSGLSSADVIYEAVAEGSITRFLAVFYCQDPGRVGPVRSARTYFLDFISEYGDYPLYAHVGGANSPGPANALGQIEDYGWFLYNDLSGGFSVGLPSFKRITTFDGIERATEHTMYAFPNELRKVAKSRGLTNVDKNGVQWDTKFVKYTFKDDAAASQRPESQSIHMELWKDYKEFAIDWKYDKKNNIYMRNTGGAAHIDRNTNKQLTAKNIVALSMLESNAHDGYENDLHLLYQDKGTGKATIFMDGKQIKGTWRKANRTARTLLFDSNGTPIEFNRGTIWFTILPTTGVMTVQ